MKLQEFINANNGNYVITSPKLGPQCVSLMRIYCRDVLGMSLWAIPAATYAYQMFENFPAEGDKRFFKIENRKDNYPIPGDIVFFKLSVLKKIIFQHVCIATGGNTRKFISFDQNWPKGKPCMYVNHNYSGCLGWLRPIKKVD